LNQISGLISSNRIELKVAGFTFIRNAIKYDYPIAEAIRSILPLCDEVYVSVGQSQDATQQLIESIDSTKIKIVHSVWNDSLRKGGQVLAQETNKVFDQIPGDVDWCIYIQGDEAIHEKYYPEILRAMKQYKDDLRVEGLLFKYLHFYASFDYTADSRNWYDHEIRIIRNDKRIRSYQDAQGFRKNGKKLQVKPIDAYIYHYGWVKPPELQLQKINDFHKFWTKQDDAFKDNFQTKEFVFDYSKIDSLKLFTDSHPQVMQDRVKAKNWEVPVDVGDKRFSLKGKILYWIEKKTGKRMFAYRNYKTV
jgi:hypothetical protein